MVGRGLTAGIALYLVVAACLPESVLAQPARLKARQTKIYSAPSPVSEIKTILFRGDTVNVLKKQGAWLQVRYGANELGWMYVGKSNKHSHAQHGDEPSLDRFNPGYRESGVSLHMGAMGSNFSFGASFFLRSFPSLYFEGTFQYAPGQTANAFLMYGTFKYPWVLSWRTRGWLFFGGGMITTIPGKTLAAKSISNMSLNYGFGISRALKNHTLVRFDLRQFAVLTAQGFRTFLNWSFGFGIQWH